MNISSTLSKLKKLTCPSFYWKIWHDLHGDGVCLTDANDIDTEQYPFRPAYMCEYHYDNHFKYLSLREMKILESEELEWYEEQEEPWRLVYLFEGKDAYRKMMRSE